MKKNLFKAVLSIITVLCIVFGFAACSGGNEGDDTSQPTENVQTASEVTELVNAYNTALAKATVSCTSAQQKVEKGALWIGDNSDETMDLLAPEQKELLAKFESTDTANAALINLKDTDVSEVSVSDNVVTYKLKPANTQNGAAQGHGGYLNIIDTDATQGLVEGVKSFANVKGNVKINSSEYAMTEGTLTVTFNNKRHKKIESVSFTGKQKVKAEMKYLVISINAELDYALTSEYKAQ